jgi:glycosyltransferase involved in cell wall biosynthesis
LGAEVNSRIALFFPSLQAGGVQRFMLTLGAGLITCGFDVDFVLVGASGPFLTQIPEGARVIDLKAKRALAALPALIRYLKQEKPGTVITAQTHINVIAMIARRFVDPKIRLVISEHSHLTSASKNSKKTGDRLRPVLARLFYPAADAVVAVSKNAADDLAFRTGLTRSSIKVVHNPFNIETISQKASKPVDHPWFNPGEVPIFLAAGRLAHAKDYPTLLRAFAMVRTQINARLVIFGEGDLRPELLRLSNELGIRTDFSLPGYTENPYAYMAKASVFVLSSAWEGFGNVLVEALACQTQVVATDCPSGPAEILDGGKYGRLVPVGNHRALAAAMLDALQHPLPVETLYKRASEFTVEKTIKGYLNAAGQEFVDGIGDWH